MFVDLPKGPLQRHTWLGPALLHLAIAVPLAAVVSVDVDEAFSLSTSGLLLANTFDRALTFELQPPLYFLILNIWRLADPGVFWARMLSVACTTGVVVISVPVARGLVPRVSAWIPATLLAVNPMLVWAAFTVRGYAFVALLSALLLYIGRRAFLGDRPNPPAIVMYALVSTAALYTQYYLGFFLVGFFCLVVASGRFKGALAYLAAMVPVALAFWPLALTALDQVGAHGTRAAPPGLVESLVEMARRSESIVMSMDRVSLGRVMRWAARLVFMSMCAIGMVGAWRSGRSVRDWAPLAVLVGTIASFFAVAMVLVGNDAVAPRHTISLLLPCMLMGLALLSSARRPFFVVAVGATVIALMSANALFRDYHDGDRHPAHRAAAAWIHDNPRLLPDQPILVFPSDSALSLGYHFTGVNPLVGLPRETSLTRYDPALFAITDEGKLSRRILGAMGGSREAWLVTYSDRVLFGVDLGADILEAYVNRSFDVIESASFEDVRVRLVRLKWVTDGH